MQGIFFLIIIKLAISLYKEWMSGNKSGMRQINYEINGKQSDISMRYYYSQLLGLSDCKMIDPQVVTKAYYDKLSQIADRRKSGEKIIFDLKVLQAANEYLKDTCNYMGAKN